MPISSTPGPALGHDMLVPAACLFGKSRQLYKYIFHTLESLPQVKLKVQGR